MYLKLTTLTCKNIITEIYWWCLIICLNSNKFIDGNVKEEYFVATIQRQGQNEG